MTPVLLRIRQSYLFFSVVLRKKSSLPKYPQELATFSHINDSVFPGTIKCIQELYPPFLKTDAWSLRSSGGFSSYSSLILFEDPPCLHPVLPHPPSKFFFWRHHQRPLLNLQVWIGTILKISGFLKVFFSTTLIYQGGKMLISYKNFSLI